MVQQFLTIITESLSDPRYYVRLATKPFFFSVAYFLIGICLVSLLFSWRVTHRTLPHLVAQLKNDRQELLAHYPQDLVIEWDENQLRVSPAQQLSLPYPLDLEPQELGLPSSFVRYDPELAASKSAETVISLLEKTPTLIAVGESSLWIQSQTGQWQPFALTEVPGFDQPFSISHETIESISQTWLDQLIATLRVTNGWIYGLSPLVLAVSALVGGLLDMLVAFVLFTKVMGIPISFRNHWAISLHLILIAEGISQLAHLLYSHVPLAIFSLSYWVLLGFILFTTRRDWYRLAAVKN